MSRNRGKTGTLGLYVGFSGPSLDLRRQEASKTPPRRLQDASKTLRTPPSRPQDGPKTPQGDDFTSLPHIQPRGHFIPLGRFNPLGDDGDDDDDDKDDDDNDDDNDDDDDDDDDDDAATATGPIETLWGEATRQGRGGVNPSPGTGEIWGLERSIDRSS